VNQAASIQSVQQGEGSEEGGDGDWLVSVLVKPIGEGIDVISGGTRAKSPPGDG
jgi:hypothetical protein